MIIEVKIVLIEDIYYIEPGNENQLHHVDNELEHTGTKAYC